MDDVDVEDEENSPMVVDTSQQQLDWRVPENGEEVEATAEISLFPEYEQVEKLFFGPESDHWLCCSLTCSLTD